MYDFVDFGILPGAMLYRNAQVLTYNGHFLNLASSCTLWPNAIISHR